MVSAPKIEEYAAQPYVGIRTQVPMSKLSKAIPQHTTEVFAWLGKQGIAPAGPPFIRYLVINMEGLMDIELGVPVAAAMTGDELVRAGMIPAGRYATLIYTGVRRGIEANGALLNWGKEQGLVWDNWPAENGDAFGARLEYFLTDPAEEPNKAKWETKVAIRLADA